MLIKVEFASFALDPEKNQPLLLLKESGGSRILPVPLGPLEASAIATDTLKVVPQKPFTIDIARAILERLDGTLCRAVITEDPNIGLTAQLEIASSRGSSRIDCRPCDAIALALRCSAPLFARENTFPRKNNDRLSEAQRLRMHVSSIDTLDFGTSYLE